MLLSDRLAGAVTICAGATTIAVSGGGRGRLTTAMRSTGVCGAASPHGAAEPCHTERAASPRGKTVSSAFSNPRGGSSDAIMSCWTCIANATKPASPPPGCAAAIGASATASMCWRASPNCTANSKRLQPGRRVWTSPPPWVSTALVLAGASMACAPAHKDTYLSQNGCESGD